MGYYTRFTGRIDIHPPLRWEEIKDKEWIDENNYPDLLIEVGEQRTETPDGEMIVKEGRAIVPYQEDSYKGYDVLDTFKSIVRAYPDHEFKGEIRAEGEETGDLRRYLVRNGEAIEEQAEFIWPDGTREQAS